MKKFTLLPLLLIAVLSFNFATAEHITFGTIESPKQFQQYWGLTQEQMQTYDNYMQIAGKFRHQNSNPLVVLSIIADDDEDKGYFAAKAAAYESQMSQREILSAWLISTEMEKQGLTQAMNAFADKLTGINSKDDAPESHKSDWQQGDALYVLIDKVCLAMHCLSQFDSLLATVPEGIAQKLVINTSGIDEKTQAVLDQLSTAIKTQHKAIVIEKYDRIEHGFLQGINNQAVQVRDRNIIRKL